MAATSANPSQLASAVPATVTGVQLMQGIGVQPAKGFWTDAWSQVLHRPRAVAALCWIGLVALFACFAPVLASGHPLALNAGGRITSPLLANLSTGDYLLALAGLFGGLLMLIPMPAPLGLTSARKFKLLAVSLLQGALTVALAAGAASYFGQRDLPQWARDVQTASSFVTITALLCALPGLLLGTLLMPLGTWLRRAALAFIIALVCAAAVVFSWKNPPQVFDYRERAKAGQVSATYTVVPWSPTQRETQLRYLPPGADFETPARDALVKTLVAGGMPRADAIAQAQSKYPSAGEATFVLGTDSLGQDVLSQMLHACRLSISIGLVSTGIAVLIGVSIGAIMGYFGGWIDTLLFRIVEVFMAIPVLFLLIVAAAVLPRNTYVMMAIIGCVTWTGAARFTRAEFMRLRNMDFVQAAQAAGLPLRSVLFKHMLPNGVTPVLVDASFAIAAAIQFEAILSFLALGPAEQASWGRLLASATDENGAFNWWLAIFPGLAIFLTALAYNTLGECLRDAIDPKLKKARV